jgi:hypothetical protein
MEGAILTNASASDRSATDYYPTPPEVTAAIAAWMDLNGQTVWEPACGAGHMCRALEQAGANVIATELHGQGYGEAGVDYLDATLPDGVQFIVTNPPFKLAEQFIKRSIQHGLPFAMLLKSQYWHSAKRRALFELHRPRAVLPLTWRPDFHFGSKGGSPTMDCIWTVWGSKPADFTIYAPLKRATQAAKQTP